MNPIIVISIIVLIITLITIWVIMTHNKIKQLRLKIEEAKTNLNTLIRDEYDTLNNIANIISEIEKEEETFKDLNNIKIKKSSNFETDRKLKEYVAEYYKYKEKYADEFKENEDLSKFGETLEDTIEYIKGIEDYYNDSVIKYNKKISSFPNIIVSKLTKNNKAELYEDTTEFFKL